MKVLTGQHLKTNDEYKNLLPRPSKEEYEALKNSINIDGQLIPIIINSQGIVIDGYTRLQICRELNLEPKTISKDFVDELAERRFVITTNLNRRHLNMFQKAEACYSIFEIETEKAKLRVRNHKEGSAEGRVLEIFARELGIGHTLTHMIIYLIRNANQELKQEIRENLISISGAYYKIKGVNKNIPSKMKSYPSYTNCLVCDSETTTPEKKGCHVHNSTCCTKCKWGR